MIQERTRIAPTPSGYLHVGNAVNALLASWWARNHGATLVLRIDDFDGPRVRPEYLADIFVTLRWLAITIDEGPADPDDFLAGWTMAARTPEFQRVRDRLLADHPGVVFVCRCSRTDLGPGGRCIRRCRDQEHPLEPGRSAVRIAVEAGTLARVGTATYPVPEGDHVLWRRDDLPSYHLGSVATDESLGITTIIRGADLAESSALQAHLAGLLPAPGVASATVIHHPLLTAPDGRKWSKSSGARARPLARDEEARAEVTARAIEIGQQVGIRPA